MTSCEPGGKVGKVYLSGVHRRGHLQADGRLLPNSVLVLQGSFEFCVFLATSVGHHDAYICTGKYGISRNALMIDLKG